MSKYDFAAQRLYIDAALAPGTVVALNRDQANYLRNVLRLEPGTLILVFNGREGEWRARLELAGKRDAAARIEALERPQTAPVDIHLLFAPIKHARLDYMVQKAVEMGASELTPVFTRRTQVHRVNIERIRANVIEAAEQCGILSLPEVREPAELDRLIANWPNSRQLVFCDEDAPLSNPVRALASSVGSGRVSVAVLIGPEGGFDPVEREALLNMPGAIAISLGPRILRADTAAVAALAIAQAALGDWRSADE